MKLKDIEGLLPIRYDKDECITSETYSGAIAWNACRESIGEKELEIDVERVKELLLPLAKDNDLGDYDPDEVDRTAQAIAKEFPVRVVEK